MSVSTPPCAVFPSPPSVPLGEEAAPSVPPSGAQRTPPQPLLLHADGERNSLSSSNNPPTEDGTMLIPSSASSASSTLPPAAVGPPVAAGSEEPLPSSLAAQPETNFSKSIPSPSSLQTQRSAQNQPSAAGSRENTNKHSNSSNSPPIATGPTAMLTAIPSPVLPSDSQLQHSSPSSSSAPPSDAGRHLEKFGAPAGSSSSAVVAPAQDSLSSSINSQPISDNRISPNSSSSPLHVRPHVNGVGGGQKQPSPAAIDPLAAFFKKVIAEAASAAPPPSSAASSSTTIDFDVHCLELDSEEESLKALLGKSPEAHEKLTTAVSLASRNEAKALSDHVKAWLAPAQVAAAAGPTTINTVYCTSSPRGPRVHINFASHDALADAMLTFPFLVRCGCLVSSWGVRPCAGVSKHSLPELLRLSCTPKEKCPQQSSIAQQLLADMKLDYSTFWFPRLDHDKWNHHGRTTISIFVLPRTVRILDLQQLVNRVHLQHDLHGAKVQVQGMNSPLLRRCNLCGQLGHEPNKCGVYSGIAVRLTGLRPFPHQAMLDLTVKFQAKNGFLGSAVTELRPSRRLTLLFDTWNEETMARFALVFSEIKHQLYDKCLPAQVKVADRFKECQECGSMEKPHSCPFSQTNVMMSRAKPAAKSSGAASSAPAVQPGDKMCQSWRRQKSCANKERCNWEHPVDHVVQTVCIEFQKSGACGRARCRFSHVAPAGAAGGAQVQVELPAAPKPATQVAAKAATAASKQQGAVSVTNGNRFAPLSNSDDPAVVPQEEKESEPVAKTPPQPHRSLSATAANGSSVSAAAPAASPSRKRSASLREPESNPDGSASGASVPVSSLSSLSFASPTRSKSTAGAGAVTKKAKMAAANSRQ